MVSLTCHRQIATFGKIHTYLQQMTDEVMDNLEAGTLACNPAELLKLAHYRMPFGKYKDRLLIDLPEPYVVWFANKGFPQGELGRMLSMVYEIKINGLEYLFEPLRPEY